MLRKGYRFTTTAKILVLKFILCSIGILCGFTWEIYNENTKWDNLIYPNITVGKIDMSGKTKAESRNLIQTRYIEPLIRKKANIIVNDKVYTMEYSKLIKDYNIDSVIDEAFSLGKDLNFYQKHQLKRKGAKVNLDIPIFFNEGYIRDFIENIEKDINSEPVNASIQITPSGNVQLISDVKGYKIQVEKLEEYIKDEIANWDNEDIDIELPIEEIEADITADSLASIDTKISSFSTSFVSPSKEKINNIELAVKALNGRILMPGEIFSFNDCVGERTKERGFMVAPVIMNGKLQNGIGGGICQVSSTLYSAILKTDMKVIERKNHTLAVAYIGLGLDATVAWESIDLKFENTLDYPIFIEGYTKNKDLYINIYSNSNLTKRKYVIENKIISTINPSTNTVNDTSLAEGQAVTVQKGSIGYRVKVIKHTYEDEQLISSNVISRDVYEPIASIVKVGINNSK